MDYQAVQELAVKFDQNFGGRQGLRCSRAPGRVNLIGEHTDYNGGFVMPLAIDREARLLFRGTDSGPVRLWSENYGEWDEFDLEGIERNESASGGWSNYLRGVAWSLQDAGYELRSIEGIVCGDVPIGAGLSSSAALEVAAATAFCDAAGCQPDTKELALLCQRAENQFVGVNCGIMDQFVSVHAKKEHALLLDCRSLEHELLPLDTSAVRVVVLNTMVHHELGSSAYNQRRARCEEAARLLNELVSGISQLRDVTPEILTEHGDALDGVTLKRARHVVSEDDRTVRAAQALRDADYELFGRLMNESHESLRVDYEVSCEELDLMAALAREQPGVLGARMVGAGFGGCTVNLVLQEHADAAAKAVCVAYRKETGIEPEAYQFVAVAGAGVERC
ncbi:MAG: galactokinase [Planctomycetota bacterium]|jgi:galactokinase